MDKTRSTDAAGETGTPPRRAPALAPALASPGDKMLPPSSSPPPCNGRAFCSTREPHCPQTSAELSIWERSTQTLGFVFSCSPTAPLPVPLFWQLLHHMLPFLLSSEPSTESAHPPLHHVNVPEMAQSWRAQECSGGRCAEPTTGFLKPKSFRYSPEATCILPLRCASDSLRREECPERRSLLREACAQTHFLPPPRYSLYCK